MSSQWNWAQNLTAANSWSYKTQTCGQAPINPRNLMKPESHRETMLNIRAAILQYHVDDKQSEEDQQLVLSEIEKVSRKIPMWQHPLLQ
jgi:hypothetical protein